MTFARVKLTHIQRMKVYGTLFMATVDKFYAVMFPFKYGKKRATIFKTAIFITIVPNAVMAIAVATMFGTLGRLAFEFMITVNNVLVSSMFLTINFLYILIIAKLIRNQRNLNKVGSTG